MGIRDFLTGGKITRLDLGTKGAFYPQQGGQGYGGVYYGSDAYAVLNGLTRPTSREYAQVRLELSSALAVVLNTVTGAFPEAELCIERESKDGEDERDPTHPALMLVEKPNAHFSGAEIMTALVRDLMTSSTGSAYLVKRRGAYNRVTELWPVPSEIMRPVWPASGEVFISGYEITIDGERRVIDPADVIHFRNDIDPSPPSYSRCGIPMLPPILQDLYIDTAAGDFTSAIMKNMGMPGVIVSPRALPDGRSVTLSPEKRDQFAADYQSRFTGAGRGRALIMGDPIDVKQLGFDPEKMSLRQIRQIAEERISAIYNIPAIVAGFGAGLEHATYANYEAATRAFWSGCIIPLQRRIATTLTRQFLWVDYAKSDQLYFEFEHDHIKALQESETEKRDRDRADFAAGGLTHHQYVSRLGVVPEGEDWMVLPTSVTAYPVNVMPAAEPALPEPPPQLALPPAPDEPPKGDEHASHRAIANQVAVRFQISKADAHRFVAGAIRQAKSDTPDRGKPLNWTDEQIEAEAIITDEDIEAARDWTRDNAPDLAELLDAETIKRKALELEAKAFRWNPRTRRYFGEDGRMVSKARVTSALDVSIDAGREEMAGYADALIAGEMDLPAYQIAMKEAIKRQHINAIATARGGWSNLTPRERGQAAKRIEEQYKYLNRSCLDFEKGMEPGALKPGEPGYDRLIHGRPIDGRMRASSEMYSSSARTAYGEADYDAAKDAAEAMPDTHQERWVRHASDSCNGCIEQGGKGWVGLGELPPIGSQHCLSNCKCEKVVRKKPRARMPKE